MTVGQLRLYNDLRIEFIRRCEHICYLLKDLRNYRLMSQFELDLDIDEEDCWQEVDCWDEHGHYYERFPAEFIYKSDEEILQWKDEVLEKQRKEKEEKEKIKQREEQKMKCQKFLQLKRIFEK